jgi:hypothetical protein
MRVAVQIVADEVNVQPDGKFNIVGGFTHIFASQFPALHGKCTIFLVLDLDPSYFAQVFDVILNWIDPDGRHLYTVNQAPLTIPVPNDSSCRVQIIVNLTGLPVTVPGPYHFRIDLRPHRTDLPPRSFEIPISVTPVAKLREVS